MYAPDRIVLAEPPFAVSPDLGMLRLEVPGDTFPYRFCNGGTWILACPDHHKRSVCAVYVRASRARP